MGQLILLLCLLAIAGVLTAIIHCPINQVPSNCASPCPPTCEDPDIVCNFLVCNKGCVCSDGYIRNTTQGKCIQPKDCPTIRRCSDPNEEYTNCGSACPTTCENYKNNNEACITLCVEGCFCKSPYIRNQQGQCVLPKDCPY